MHTIKHNNKIKYEVPDCEFDVTNLTLTNLPTLQNLNTDILTRNNVSGDIEILDRSQISNNVTLNNVGSGTDIIAIDGTNNTFNFKSLVAGAGISITSNATEITISATGGSGQINLQNGGTGFSLITPASTGLQALPGPLNFRSLTAGAGISIGTSGNNIVITNTSLSGTNIYNSNGQITTERTVTFLSGTNLTFQAGPNNNINFNNSNSFNVTTAGTGLGINIESGTSLSLRSSSSSTIDIQGDNLIRIGSIAPFPTGITIGNNPGLPLLNLNAQVCNFTPPVIRLLSIPAGAQSSLVHINPGTRELFYSDQIPNPPQFLAGTIVWNNVAGINVNTTIIQIPSVTSTVIGNTPNIVSTPIGNGLQYFPGVGTKLFSVLCSGSFSITAGTPQNVTVYLFLNGVSISQSNQVINNGLYASSVDMPFSTRPITISLNNTDNITIGFTSASSAITITFTANLSLHSVN